MSSPGDQDESREYEVEYHKSILTKFCRLCKQPSERKLTLAKPYMKVIENLHNIEIGKDNENIHPQHICHTCRCRLERFKKAKHSRKHFETQFEPEHFTAHGNDCVICKYEHVRPVTRNTPDKNETHPHVANISPYIKRKCEHDHSSSSSKARKTLKFDTRHSTGKSHELDSFPLDYFIEQDLAEKLKCRLCLGVPKFAAATECGHLFCTCCIRKWLENASTCPTCQLVQSNEDIFELDKLPISSWSMFSQLHISCKFKEKGCKEIYSLQNVEKHENNCRYGKYRAAILNEPVMKVRGPGKNKEPLLYANRQYVRSKRLKGLIEYIQSYCTERCESRLDVLFFLLGNELTEMGMQQKSVKVKKLWEEETPAENLSVDECLAMRVELLQSKGQYENQYHFFSKMKGDKDILKPPSQLDKAEECHMPENVEYEIIGQYQSECAKHDIIDKSVPINVIEDFQIEYPEFPIPNCKGVRWNYPNALAKTLQELDPFLEDGLRALDIEHGTDLLIKTFVKDGGDGMGEIAVHKERGERYLPDKVLRFGFCVFECRIIHEGTEHIIFTEELPNSVRTNRPLLEVICDENDKAAATVCITPIEMERTSLSGKVIKVKVGEIYRRHEIKFLSSMEDEKYDRAFGGLQGAGSAYLCTLCHATRETARSKVGSFTVERTFEETSTLSSYLELNPDNLSQDKLNKIAKGVKAAPILLTQPRDRMIDATHADINMGSFFKKLIVRLIAGVNQWDATAAVKQQLIEAEAKFDIHMKRLVGINPQLMMPGNYARTLFDSQNRSHILHLIKNEDSVKSFHEILDKFQFMRSVYRAIKPESDKVKQYKQTAIDFALLLDKNFKFAKWPNYLHKLVEHVQELIEDQTGPGSIGAVSGEGSEAGNKLFRHFRKHMASRGNTYNGLRDVLRLHWLYSSPKLHNMAKVSHNRYKCSICHTEGHNKVTCPALMQATMNLGTTDDPEGYLDTSDQQKD